MNVSVTNNTRYRIKTPDGFKPFSGIRSSEKIGIAEIYTDSGLHLRCTLDHPLKLANGTFTRAIDLTQDSLLSTSHGISKVTFVSIDHEAVSRVYDALEVGTDHEYLTSGFVSHNCSFIGKAGGLLETSVLKRLETEVQKPVFETHQMKQYEKPVPGNIYMMTVDVSRGRGLDYSTFTVFDVSDMPIKQVCVFRDNKISPIDYAGFIRTMGHAYNDCQVLVELNDLGQQVADILHFDYGYEGLMFTESSSNGRKKQISAGFGSNALPGITTTKTTKSVGCNAIKLMIEQGRVKIVDAQTVDEFKNFVRTGDSYAAASGEHDDLAMNFVLFGWIADQTFFTDLTGVNMKETLATKDVKALYDELEPFFVGNQSAPVTKTRIGGFEVNDWSDF